MPLRLEARPEPSRAMLWLSPVLAAVLAAAGGGLVFAALGYDPLVALRTLFLDPLSTLDGLTELGLKATPLLLCAIGIAVAVQAGLWNIGAEGQLTMGAIAGGGIALAFGGEGHWWILPAMLLAGAAGGAAWAAIPALLKTRFHAHEILTTLMLSYVAVQFLGWLVHGPWIDPEGFNFPQSRMFEADALLPVLVEGTRLHAGVLLALLAVPLAWALLARTVAGYRLRTIGLAPRAARYAGFSAARGTWLGLCLAGALAGLAGLCEAAGPVGQLQPLMSPGYGFAAIIVAFLGRLQPFGILLAALLMALIYLGGEQLQVSMQLPIAATGTIQGMLLFFLLASDVFIDRRLVRVARRHA
ncbi:ABC transporter permease [Roseicella sp. DB1501]|uniref:ABC transporter permease n=1 Tax=Roseicella sp. DB1501 TaxID=2730925 RepID=UPI001491E1CF|nr:ABC transporter permease [Roseicella sp. DB1501]NOG71446.1 ABC transporter permease [Roseicella sp. DB1501]